MKRKYKEKSALWWILVNGFRNVKLANVEERKIVNITAREQK